MPPCQHVIWDWNGTLLDDVQACADAINILLSRRSLPQVTLDEYLNVFDFPVRDYYLKLGFDFETEKWDLLAREYHAAYARTSAGCGLRTGTKSILDTLQKQGIGLSILSACELGLLKRMMAERGILDYFDHIYGLSDLYAHSKLELGHALIRDTGLSPGNAVLVGDTTHDHEVARAMGVRCLLMAGGHQATRKLTTLGCPVVPDYPRLIEQILKGPA